MKAAASGSVGKSFTSPWRMANFKPGNSRSVELVIFIVGEYSIRSTRRSGGQEGKATTPAPHLPLGWGASRKTFNLHETGRTLVLGVRGGLEHVLHGLLDRRARARKQSNTLPDSLAWHSTCTSSFLPKHPCGSSAGMMGETHRFL